MSSKLSILGFAGSLRQCSYNRVLLRAAQEMVPSEARLEIFDLAGIPFFNQDQENQPIEKVKEFKAAIRAADALLIATPEYNYSMPGVLKNALDSASRPYGDNALDSKPVYNHGRFHRNAWYSEGPVPLAPKLLFFEQIAAHSPC